MPKHRGDFNVRTFRCLDQFLCMAFAQLTYRESLRDIEACLGAQPAKALPSGHVLVAIVKKRLNLDLSLHAMLQILSVTPFEKMPLTQLLTDMAPAENGPDDDNQLILP